MKYIVVETRSVKETNPYWSQWSSHIEPRTIVSNVERVQEFDSQEALSKYLASTPMANVGVRIYEVSRELTPVIETKTVVSFK